MKASSCTVVATRAVDGFTSGFCSAGAALPDAARPSAIEQVAVANNLSKPTIATVMSS